jgi:hypothetical protein
MILAHIYAGRSVDGHVLVAAAIGLADQATTEPSELPSPLRLLEAPGSS